MMELWLTFMLYFAHGQPLLDFRMFETHEACETGRAQGEKWLTDHPSDNGAMSPCLYFKFPDKNAVKM